MKKWIKWIVLAVLLVIVVAVVAVLLNLNAIIRSTVQTQATASMNLQTTLDSARLSLLGGRLGLNDLAIASPQGFSAPHLLTLDKTVVQVEYGQLTKQPIRIAKIALRRPTLVIEQSGGKLNFKAAMDQMPPSEPSQLQLVIDEMIISGAKVLVKPGVPGLADQITLDLPSITLTNIGTGPDAENGAAIKDVANQVITAMAAKAADSDRLPPEVRALLTLNVEELRGRIQQEVSRQIGNITQDVQQKLGEELKKATGEQGGKALEQQLGGFLRSATQPATKPAR